MASEGRRTVRRPQEGTADEPVCPACGQPVGKAIHRRKVLGAWVPSWEPRPCHNPECELFGRTPHGAEARPSGKPGGGPGNEPGNHTETG
ncbi:hypothetical protein [Streptomyces thermolilacinus]|uniref:Uncharacterized protein n=1 Tax=Streptomyces thermolilacinus SPC6 TaxID=1306406 RepID=A0A1D3DQ63_9ACTN|nr:hypothetical protein [Streptomyces thermolilacinus]OEJ94454.1 hypothetical protein J116_008210 [Streptomyces thermolilacinus SPC6]